MTQPARVTSSRELRSQRTTGAKPSRLLVGLGTAILVVGLAITGVHHVATASPGPREVVDVYVVDHAGGWPIAAAVRSWSRPQARVQLHHVRNCPAHASHCVLVLAQCKRYDGQTHWGATEVLPRHPGAGTIRLCPHSSSGGTAPQSIRESIACHELGHALIASDDPNRYEHRGNSRTSCLSVGPSRPPHPDRTDFGKVDRAFAHVPATRRTG